MTQMIEAAVNTDARRKASAAYFEKRERAGLRRVTVWLSPTARETLERISDRFGSKDATVEEALHRLARELDGQS